MAFVNWDEKYSVSVKLIDDEHKKWLSIINQLYDAMSQGKGTTVLDEIFVELAEYTEVHFRDEESLLEKTAYPDLEKHRGIHREMVKNVREYREKFQSGASLVSITLLTSLKDWLTNHILNTDKLYQTHLQSHGIH